jgi:hypothetical protein
MRKVRKELLYIIQENWDCWLASRGPVELFNMWFSRGKRMKQLLRLCVLFRPTYAHDIEICVRTTRRSSSRNFLFFFISVIYYSINLQQHTNITARHTHIINGWSGWHEKRFRFKWESVHKLCKDTRDWI